MQTVLITCTVIAAILIAAYLYIAKELFDSTPDCENCYLKEQCLKHFKETGKTLCDDEQRQ